MTSTTADLAVQLAVLAGREGDAAALVGRIVAALRAEGVAFVDADADPTTADLAAALEAALPHLRRWTSK